MIRAAMTACVMLATVATVPARACMPLESIINSIETAGATFEVFRDKEQTKRAAEFYASLPPVEPTPEIDGFLIVRMDGKPTYIVLTRGTGACFRANISDPRSAEFAMIFIFGRSS